MDIGAEISKKIQMAITAKLKELDAYVDDELPDYIMIMVANKKTEEQMTDALSLFLSGNTKTFTSWLHSLLSSLRKGKGDKGQNVRDKESGPTEKVADETSQRRSSTDKVSQQKKSSDQHRTDTGNQSATEKTQSEAIITIDSDELHELFDEELIAESSAAELMAPEMKVDKPLKSSKQVSVSQKDPNLEAQQGAKSRPSTKVDKSLKRKPSESSVSESQKVKKQRPYKVHSGSEKLEKRRSKNYNQQSSKRIQSDVTSEKSVREWDRGKGKELDKMLASSSYRKCEKNRDQFFYSDSEGEDETIRGRVSSTVNQMMKDPEFVSDSGSEDDSKSKVSSRVTFPKRTMRVPIAKQANKALFMKAVNAAEKSVNLSSASSKSDAQSDETEQKSSTVSKNKLSDRFGKRGYADNDVRRKLQIKKAINEAFQPQHATSSRRGSTKSRPSKHQSSSENSKPSVARKPPAQQITNSISTARTAEAKGLSPPKNLPQTDQRKFIIQRKRKQIDQPAVAFDSRETLSRTSQDKVNVKEKMISPPSSITNHANSIDKATPSNVAAPNFIVTMDGVIRSKHNNQLSEDEKKDARLKKFKGNTNSTNSATKVPSAKSEEPSSAMHELEKMKDKILQVERESTKLKQMQIKLAAVQNGTVTPSGNEQKSISVANVHYSTTEKQLSDYFSICGKVLRTTILRDIATGHPKGFAYLEFDDSSAVTSALALNNTQLNNRVIRVTIKQPSSPVATYQLPRGRGYHRPYRGRATHGFSPAFQRGRFSRYGAHKVVTRNKTWVNPAISGFSL